MLFHVTILLVAATVQIKCINIIPEYYLQSGSLGHCGETKTGEVSVFIKSHIGAGSFGGVLPYNGDQNCQIQVDVAAGKVILMQYELFDLEQAPDTTCRDYIVIDGGAQLCTEPAASVSSTHQVTVQFISDSANHKKGFSMLMTSFHTGACASDEFLCDTNRCISEDLKCDGASHCVDGADEDRIKAGCTLLDDVVSSITGLGLYGLLAIVVVTAAIILTIFIVVIAWRAMGPDGSCSCRSRVDDVEEEPTEAKTAATTRKSSMHSKDAGGKGGPMKKKKSVTITIADKPTIPLPAVEAAPATTKNAKRAPKKANVQPVVTVDSEW